MKILITGSTGFVGKRFVKECLIRGLPLRCASRSSFPSDLSESTFIYESLCAETNWASAFDGIDCIVHCAALVHQMNEPKLDYIEAYREVNVRGTLNLARQAAKAGVKRFVFLSSIKVNGEFSAPNRPFTSDSSYIPEDPYGLSKFEAEQQLRKLAKETGLEVVIIRPTLVYGPGVKANFLTMLNWVKKGVPLPLGAIHNQRSLVYIDNLVDLMLLCCNHPKAADETFLVSDDDDISTTSLITSIARAMGKNSRLLPIPMFVISCAGRLLGRSDVTHRLQSNLQVDISNTKNLLGWKPPISFEQGIKETVDAYLQSKSV